MAAINAHIAITKVKIHPDFTGFGNPSVNDDIAVLTLARDLPRGVPTYDLPDGELTQGMVFTTVGYGRSGDGIYGYNTPASFHIKRVGENTADAFFGQDDAGRPEANEVFHFDYDGPNGNGPLGGETLGNDRETTIGAGDSGGPAFADAEGGLTLMGMVTYVQGADAPKFGSMGGGVNLFWYLSFINSVLHPGTGGGLILPGPPSAGGRRGILGHDAVPVRFGSLPSWAGDTVGASANQPSVASASDDDADEASTVLPGDRPEAAAPTPTEVRLTVGEPLVGVSPLSADSDLFNLLSGEIALP